MQFLADAGISRRTVEFLRLRGHDAVHVRELALQRAADSELVDRARRSLAFFSHSISTSEKYWRWEFSRIRAS